MSLVVKSNFYTTLKHKKPVHIIMLRRHKIQKVKDKKVGNPKFWTISIFIEKPWHKNIQTLKIFGYSHFKANKKICKCIV